MSDLQHLADALHESYVPAAAEAERIMAPDVLCRFLAVREELMQILRPYDQRGIQQMLADRGPHIESVFPHGGWEND